MKLLVSLSYYSPYLSGLTLSVKRLAELLAKSGYHVTILTTQHEKQLPRTDEINSVSVVRVPYLFRVSKGFVMPRYVGTAYKELYNTDTVVIILPQAEGWILAFLAKLLGRKVVCLYVCEVVLPKGFISKMIEWALRICNRMALSFADEIVTLTDDFALHNHLLRDKKVFGIYPVMIPPKINADEKRALEEKLPDKKYYIGFLGRMAHEKGIVYLLEAISLLQKNLGNTFVVVLAGPRQTVGEEKYQKYIVSLLKKYPEHVIQLGELTDDQLGAFYSLLDILVLPSTDNTEAFGMVQVEAMYCGTPVVGTNLPGVRVPIQETGMGEIVSTKNTKELAETLVKVLQNKKKYVKEKDQIQKIFSEEKILKAYQKVFKGE
jgi:glycosyltransferase involved in cell wall biosynthesis